VISKGRISLKISTEVSELTTQGALQLSSQPVTDSNGNATTQVTRTVNVVDTTKPVIALLGNTPISIEVGSVYKDAGATASDSYSKNLTSSIVTVNSVNTALVGVYTVTYNVSDSSGNAAIEVIRTVNVVNSTLGVENLESYNFVFYPNPATDYINIKVPSTINEIKIVVTNLLGQQIYYKNVTSIINNIYRMDTHRFRSGTYVIRFISNKVIATKKLIIK